jgi:hypothetical protein
MFERELINDRNNMKPVIKLIKVCMCPDIFDLCVLNFRLNPVQHGVYKLFRSRGR